jgi:uncharacterized protein (TIGR02231 family)
MKILRAFSIVMLCLFAHAGLCLGLDIKKVILFNDQALVSFDHELSGHLSIDAPPEIVPDSLILTPLAGGSVRSVSVEPARTMSGKVKDIKDSLSKKQAALAKIRRDQAMLEKQIDIIYDAAGSKGKATAFEKAHLADALGFIENRVTALNNRVVELAGKTEQIEMDIKDLQNQLNKVSQNPGYRIEITGNGPVEVSYAVRAASWKPEYKVYALPGTNRITVESSVQARQSSGIDWDIKEMLISTGKPSFGIEAPELQPWYLYKASKRSAKLKAESYDRAPMAASAPMEEPEAAVEATTTSYLIGAAKNIHLPGDGTPAMVKLTKNAFNADYSLISIPKYSESAFLRASFTLDGTAPLVPGSYSSFVDGVFSGRGGMKHVEPGQKMTLDLGMDEGIKVERRETQAFHDNTLVGKDRMTYSYEITIENTRKLKASITLKDQIPISRDKTIAVDLIKSDPEVKPDQDGILTWTLDLDPRKKKKASFTFSIVGDAYALH